MRTGRRLFVVDPSLKDARGHHFTLTKNVSVSARNGGLDVYWLAALDASDELQSSPELIPTFGRSMYSAYQSSKNHKKNFIVSRLSQLRSLLLPASRLDAQRLASSSEEGALKASIEAALGEAIKTYRIGPSDRVLFHTADGATYEALSDLMQTLDPADLPQIHVCTPYDPFGVMPNRRSPGTILDAINQLKALHLLGRRIYLHAENQLLAKHLSEVWGCKVSALNLPAQEITEDMKFHAREFRKTRLHLNKDQFLVVSLGAARLEKGFHLFPDVVRRVFEFAGEGEFAEVPAAKIKFVLQASAQIVGRHPNISKAIEKLQFYPKDRVELLMEPLSDLDYGNLTLASDAILMPYDQEAYRVRGSGVVSEAILARKFIVAKARSYPGVMAQWQGGACGETPAEMARALLTIIKHRWQRFERVRQASEEYLQANSVERYINKIIEAERDRSDQK